MKISTNFTKKTAAEFPDAKDIFPVWADLYPGRATGFEKNFKYNNLVRDYRMHIADGPYIRQHVEAGHLVQTIDSVKGFGNIERITYEFIGGDLFSIDAMTYKVPGSNWVHATINIDHGSGKAKKNLIQKLYSEPIASMNVLSGAAFDDIIMRAVRHHTGAVRELLIKAVFSSKNVFDDKKRITREFYICKDIRKDDRNISVNGSPFSFDHVLPGRTFASPANVGYDENAEVSVSRQGCEYITIFPEIRAKMDMAKSPDESFRIGVLECVNNYVLKRSGR